MARAAGGGFHSNCGRVKGQVFSAILNFPLTCRPYARRLPPMLGLGVKIQLNRARRYGKGAAGVPDRNNRVAYQVREP